MINREFEKEATIVLYNCKYFPNNKSEAEKIVRDLADELDVTIVSSNFYQHSGAGIKATYIIEESLIAMDTWPEYGTIIIRISTCNPNSNFEKLEKCLKRKFRPDKIITYHQGKIPIYLVKKE
jgi:S-adenosylmethionine/arginine decarboxylase-like enzyme